MRAPLFGNARRAPWAISLISITDRS